MVGLIESIALEKEARYQRDKEIVAARESGLSYASIGRVFQLSGANVKNRIERFYRKQKISESADPFQKLSPITTKLLYSHGLSTIESVVAAYNQKQLLSIRNFGMKRLKEVRTFFPV